MSQSKNTGHVFGSIDIINFADLNNARITGLAPPIEGQDAANKEYVDNKVIASNLTGGVGITVNTVNNTINSNPSQTQIVALGTIQTGTWTANTIQIPYGGTGQTNFTVNKLIYHNSANKLASVPELTYTSNTIDSSIPIVCSSTTDTPSSLSTTGSLIVKGGANITKRLYVHGPTVLHSDVTVGNLTINGTLGLNLVLANNSEYYNITTGGLVVNNYLTSTSSESINLSATNATLSNAVIISNTTANEIITDTLNVPNLGIFGTINSTRISNGSLITLSSYATNTSSANTTTTNLRVSSAIMTNCNNTNTSSVNLIVSTLLTSQSSNLLNFIGTHGNISNITNTNLITTNSTINNIINTNISSNSGYINSISAGNIQVTTSVMQNLTSTNITASNTTFTNTSIGILRVTGNTTMSNVALTNMSVSNINLSTLFTSNLNNQTSTTIGRLNVTGLSVFSTTNSTSTSTGTLYSNISENITSSIGTLNVAGNINNSTGTIYTENVTSDNLYASNLTRTTHLLATNLTTTNLRSTGVSIQATVLSTNLSTGTLNVGGLTTLLNLSVTNTTSTNNFVSNETVNNLRVTSNTTTNTVITNSTTSNGFTVNANITTATSNNLLVSKIMNITGNYQGPAITTAGSFFTVLPSTFISSSPSGVSIPNWYPNYINVCTLSAVNPNVTTTKVANFYIKSNVQIGGNQTVTYNSGMTLGYVSNTTSGNLNTQISFERSDGLPISGIYTENITNKLIVVNGSLSGGGGMGIHTIKSTPIVFSTIQSSTSRDPQDYVEFLDTKTTFYSTSESQSTTTGSLVLYGGLGVDKTLHANTVKAQALEITGDSTMGNLNITGSLTQTGYGLFSLTTTSHSVGTTDIEFTSGNLSSGIVINTQPFTIGASIVLENVITFQNAGVYNLNLYMNSSTSATSASLIQTHINKFVSGAWQVYQTCSQKITFDSNTDIVSTFMIDTQANEHIKITIDNGLSGSLTIDNNPVKSRLMIHKIG